MAVCLNCNQKSDLLGQLCTCGMRYMVHDDHGKEPLNLLGKLIANKFIPTAVVEVQHSTIVYETFQPIVDRVLGLTVLKPELAANTDIKNAFLEMVDKCAGIKQQNTPIFFEVLELASEGVLAVTTEAYKGDKLIHYLRSNVVDPVGLMHIIHQILQAVAALHRKNVLFPHISMDNIRIMRSGGDALFVKIRGFIEANLTWQFEQNSPTSDVYHVGQLALTLICAKPVVGPQIELPPERAYLMPIVQIFMRAIAPAEQRYESCVELLQAFESAFALNSRPTEKPVLSSQPAPTQPPRRQSPVPFEQIIWMHRPPQPQD